eukprot:TRINITY_DN49_c0_g2_i1.p1 TRINITY_DN49_c0_g2~~TRINITY_DN49_c0_g2_i1.p1  ORF type:complete len:1669 (+),score=594.41 TRINITY_DN49_c0_g2_i1:98-5104(+)
MPVFSKPACDAAARRGERRSAALMTGAAGVGALGLASVGTNFVSSGGQQVANLRGNLPGAQTPAASSSSVSSSSATAATSNAGVLGVASTGLAAALAGASASKARAQRRRSAAAVMPVQQPQAPPSKDVGELAGLAADLLAQREQVNKEQFARQLQQYAAKEVASDSRDAAQKDMLMEVISGAEQALQGSQKDFLRWASSTVASMLLTMAMTVQPAMAANPDEVVYSDFLKEVQKGDVEMVRVQKDLLAASYTSKDGSRHQVNLVPNAEVEDQLFSALAEKKVDVVVQNANAQDAGPTDFLTRFAGPIAWLIAGLLLLFGGTGNGMGGMTGPGGVNPMEVGKAKARVIKDGDTKVKFDDVAGCDGAKEELVEVVDFLKNTSRYSELGAKIPKGALLVGPPGTGKTLLAKAVAGEAGVPFFSISAAEFVEVFAGVGASRVRDLFEQAKKSAPCIIFMDEIDAVGRQRSQGFGQGNDEREQTVNQLLTEMDGFSANNGVVVLAATNRADILDKALVRPGRFDRQIQVDPPDVQGRTEILKVHARDKTLAPGVDLTAIARQTPGMSGADLANLLNEGAIVAARNNKTEVDQDDIANALERISIGLEKKDAVMSEKKKKLVAYHEAGHAILGALMNDFDVVAKISIVPRGPAGGVTIFMPSEERLETGLYSKEFLENRMCVALGGRIAEELLNGEDNVTTGASNDFQQCTQVASTMVTQLGMSDVVGQRVIGGQSAGNPFMGGGQGAPPVSQTLKSRVDKEVKRIVVEQYVRGKKILESNRFLLDRLSEKLMEEEKVSGQDLMKLITQVAAEGKLVDENTPVASAAAMVGEKMEKSSGEAGVQAAAACVGEACTTPMAKSQCLHPDKPLMLACGDCPRRGAMPAADTEAGVQAAAAVVGESTAAPMVKSQCLHPDKPLMFACHDCPRKGKMAMPSADDEADVQAAAAFVGESTTPPQAKSQCLHPDKPLMFACHDCPRKGKMAGFVGRSSSACSRSTSSRCSAIARYGLSASASEAKSGATSDVVFERVSAMAEEATSVPVSAELVRSVSSQVLAALAATALPLAASAEDAVPPQPTGQQPGLMQMQQQQSNAPRVSGRATYSRLMEFIEEGSVQRVDLYDMGRTAVAQVTINGKPQQLVADIPGATVPFMEKLQKKDVAIEVHQPEKPNEMFKVLGDIAFPLLIIGGLLFLRSRSGSGGGGMPGFGQNPMQSRAKIMVEPKTGVAFKDVAGIDEAKEELTEIVDFLKAPERFIKVGAKIPRGVLLTGPPGTGKTLMAKALAGESGVPFIQSSAAEFIELFVGVGASRVRDIFKQAKEKAPCIVFIDEIDAIGRQRGAGMGGGNDEREQTLNQILTEMDGFEGSSGVIVVAATNRADILDNALLRPGRFDRRVTVGLPDVKGREQILKVHVKNKTLAEDLDLSDVAKRTSGFSGADLENLMNESAILAARRGLTSISNKEVADATDRVIAGLAGRALPDNASKKLIAYHEAGHALVGTLLPHHDMVNKVTLIPRGNAKGLTWFTPGEDQSLISTNMMKARITGALGGRAAEQIVFGAEQVTSGAGGDLQKVEQMARAMVTQLGMSPFGTLALDDGNAFTGPNYSDDVSASVDKAIKGITDECYLKALTVMIENRSCLDRIADELVEAETLSGDRLRELIAEYTEIPEKMSIV